jgi:hypothetical protein
MFSFGFHSMFWSYRINSEGAFFSFPSIFFFFFFYFFFGWDCAYCARGMALRIMTCLECIGAVL